MARSSGGGSRSGGSRGGGSRSRSRSGGSRSGGTTKSSICSKRPREGCKKYRYFDKQGKEQFIYCNYDPNPDNRKKSNRVGEIIFKVFLSFFYLPFFIATIAMFATCAIPYDVPLTKEQNPNSLIYIYDTIDVIENTDELRNSLTAFYQKTGVTPAVLTVSHDEWEDYYYSMKEYALEQYYKRFSDETHWLIVYSEPVGEDFNDWAWEGIIGDDTVSAISDQRCEQLTDLMQKNLYRGVGVGRAITDTFNTVAESYKTRYDLSMLLPALIMGVFVTFHYSVMIGAIGRKKYYKGAELVDKTVISAEQEEPLLNFLLNSRVIKCDYCGSTYNQKESYSCPHCGGNSGSEVKTIVNGKEVPEGIFVKDSNSDMV